MDDTNNNPIENENIPENAPESYEDFLKRQGEAAADEIQAAVGEAVEETAAEDIPAAVEEIAADAEPGGAAAEVPRAEAAADGVPAVEEIPDQETAAESFDEFMSRQEGVAETAAAEDVQADEAALAEAEAEAAAEQEKIAKVKKKRRTTITLTVVLIVLVAAAAALAWMLFGKQASGDYSSPVVTVDGESSDGYEFALSFSQLWQYYSYYGMSDTATLKQNVVDQLAYINMTAKAAKDAGLELDEDDLAQAEEQINAIVKAAEESSVTTDELIRRQYGIDIPMEKLKAILDKQSLAQKYIDKVIADKNAAYAEKADEIEAEYEANRKSYDVCNVSYIFLDSTEDAVHITDAVAEGKSLGDAAAQIASDAEIKQISGYTYEVLSQSFSQDAADWIFKTDDDGNYITKDGAAKVVTIQGGTYVLYQNSVPSRDETVGVSGNPVWVTTVIDNLTNKDMQSWYDEFTASYKDKIITDDAAINTIIAAITGQGSAQTTAAVQAVN